MALPLVFLLIVAVFSFDKFEHVGGSVGVIPPMMSFGSFRSFDSENLPPGRIFGGVWKNGEHAFLFGGRGEDRDMLDVVTLDDFWELDLSLEGETNFQWRWIKGSNTGNALRSLVIPGRYDEDNTPGGLFLFSHWNGINEHELYVMGGSSGEEISESTNELWIFDSRDTGDTSFQWKLGWTEDHFWQHTDECSYADDKSYSAVPPTLVEATAVKSSLSTVLIFGGFTLGGCSSGLVSNGLSNHLWEIDMASMGIRHVKGYEDVGGVGLYGEIGESSPKFNPASRKGSQMWFHDGTMYLFGGYSDVHLGGETLNDFWTFNVRSSQWTFLGGNMMFGGDVVWPESRQGAITYVKNGELYLHGGVSGASLLSAEAEIGNIFAFSPSTNNWRMESAYEVAGEDAEPRSTPHTRAYVNGVVNLGGDRVYLVNSVPNEDPNYNPRRASPTTFPCKCGVSDGIFVRLNRYDFRYYVTSWGSSTSICLRYHYCAPGGETYPASCPTTTSARYIDLAFTAANTGTKYCTGKTLNTAIPSTYSSRSRVRCDATDNCIKSFNFPYQIRQYGSGSSSMFSRTTKAPPTIKTSTNVGKIYSTRSVNPRTFNYGVYSCDMAPTTNVLWYPATIINGDPCDFAAPNCWNMFGHVVKYRSSYCECANKGTCEASFGGAGVINPDCTCSPPAVITPDETADETIADTPADETADETIADTPADETIADTPADETLEDTVAPPIPLNITIRDCPNRMASANPRHPCRCMKDNPACWKRGSVTDHGFPAAAGNVGKHTRRGDDDGVLSWSENLVGQMCYNEYWGAYVSLDNKLMMFGEAFENSYLLSDVDVEDAVEINTEDWYGAPVRVQCTRSSIFVLTHLGDLYYLGRNHDHEIPGDMKLTTFTHVNVTDERNIQNIYASHHALYALYYDLTNIAHANGTVDVYRIKVIGKNLRGSFGANFTELFSALGRFVEIDYQFVTDLYDSFAAPVPELLEYDENDDGFVTPIVPRIKAMEAGLWVTYKAKVPQFRRQFDPGFVYYHFYAGMSHPSLLQDTRVLRLVDFDGVRHSELTNADPIDWVDRIYEGCMFIVSMRNIYIAGGAECAGGPGIQPNSLTIAPFDIEEYGDYNGEVVYDFDCNSACYLTTLNGVYMWGSTVTGLGIGAVCENDNCVKPTFAGENIAMVVPGSGTYELNENQDMDVKYDTIWFEKLDPFFYSKDYIVYEYPPSLESGSGMHDNKLKLVLKKPAVFFQLLPEILFYSGNKSFNPLIGENICTYPMIGETAWKLSHSDAHDFYELELTWETFRNNCAVAGPISDNEDYDYYTTRLVFVENFFRGMLYEGDLIKKEEFLIDIEVRFPKKVLQTSIIVQQDEFSEYWDAYITDKSFNREDRRGIIEFATVIRRPNFLVFPELAIEALVDDSYHHFPSDVSGYTYTERLGDVVPNIPTYFRTDEDSYWLEELGALKKPLDWSGLDCDSINCYQRYLLHFRIIDDPRVCHIPETQIPVRWVSFCKTDEMSEEYYADGDTLDDHVNCVVPSREVEFVIRMSVDNLCGGELVENIDAVMWMYLYADWTYTEPPLDTETVIFEVGDWLYFKAGVDSTKVTIEGCRIDTVTMEDNSGTVRYLYYLDETTGERANTPLGDRAQMVIDDLPEPNEVGFHFKLHNELLLLQPNDKKTFVLLAYISVTYMGNVADVRPVAPVPPRRETGESVSLGNAVVSHGMDLTVSLTEVGGISGLPYVIVIGGLVLGAISVAVLLVVGFVTTIKALASIKSKRKEVEKPKKKEAEEEENV